MTTLVAEDPHRLYADTTVDFGAARASLRGQIQRLEWQLGSTAVDRWQEGRAVLLPHPTALSAARSRAASADPDGRRPRGPDRRAGRVPLQLPRLPAAGQRTVTGAPATARMAGPV